MDGESLTHGDVEAIKNMVDSAGTEILTPEELAIYSQFYGNTKEDRDTEHYENLAKHIDQGELLRLGDQIVKWFDDDEQSRADWMEREKKGLRILGVSEKTEGGAAFQGASKVVHPLLAEAVTQFHSRVISEMWPPDGPVKTIVMGESTPPVEAQAKRVQDYMNYLYLTEMPGAFEEEDTLLFRLPLSGSCFKKLYHCPIDNVAKSVFIEPSDFVVPYRATNLRTTPRYAHRVYDSPNTVAKKIAKGYYISGNYYANQPEQSIVRDEIDIIEGRSDTYAVDGNEHTIIEMVVDLDLDGYEDKDDKGETTGVALPYIVTVNKDDSRVLRIQRKWAKNDQNKVRTVDVVHYKYTPGLGFYGFGLLHLVGGLSRAATGALRALLDAANFANVQGGYRSRNLRLKNGENTISPGVWQEVECDAEELQKSFYTPPFKEPSTALFQLLNLLDEKGQRLSSTTDSMIGDAPSNSPVGTVLANLEHGAKVFSAIFLRIHKAHAEEYKILARICYNNLPEEGYPYRVPGADKEIMWSDFDDRVDVAPVSDPNIVSNSQRIAQGQAILDLAERMPEVISELEAAKNMLSAMRVPNMERFLIQGQKDPFAEKVKALELRIKELEAMKQEAEVAETQAKTVNEKVAAQYSAIQAAGAVAQNTAILPTADSLLDSAGNVDETPDEPIMVPAAPSVNPIQQNPDTNPLTPSLPVSPEIGVNNGFETQEITDNAA